jgi:hypothetical protein
MWRRTGSALCAAAAVLLPAVAFAAPDEAEVSATVDTDEVPIDGVVTLQVSVSTSSKGEPPELQLPALRDFDVVSRSQSEQVSFQFVGGQPSFRRTTVYSIALTPHRQGKAAIEAATVEYRGKRHQTQRIPITVGGPSSGQQRRSRNRPPPDDALDAFARSPFAEELGDADPFRGLHPGAKDVILRATVDNERPFVGQQVTYSLHLLSRVNVSGIDKLQLPRLDGFWNEEIEAPQQLVGESRVIDGVTYRGYLLRKRALFPLRSGKAGIEPADVEVLTGFGMLFSRSSLKRSSQRIHLDVQPLPPSKPAGFDEGNVGLWSLTASAEPASTVVGQPVTFKLQISGRGNVRNLVAPKLPAIAGLRAFDATSTDKSTVEQAQVGGTRTVEQLLVPERSGEFQIPPLAMETFDPVARSYKTIRTQPLTITVRVGSPGPDGVASGGRASQTAAQNVLAASGLRPIRLKIARLTLGAPPWTRPWFWPLFGVGPAGAVAALVALRVRRALAHDAQGQRVRGAAQAARKRLRGAEAILSAAKAGKADSPAFHAEVARALTQYLVDKQSVAAPGMTREQLAAALAARGHSQATITALSEVLDRCDQARFSPGPSEVAAQQALLSRAEAILEQLERKGRK